MRTFEHERFVGLSEHLDRLERSIDLAGLEGPLDRRGLCQALDTVARTFPCQDTKIRFDHLAGPALALGSSSRLLIQATELSLPPASTYEQGVACKLSELRRVQPEVKQASWVVERRATEGEDPQNFESILVDSDGQLLEGVMSNLFWVRGGVVHTAPAAGVLPGITRDFVMHLAKDLGLSVREEYARSQALGELEEAFFTTSVRSVIPIVRIADQVLGDGAPGPCTLGVMKAYSDFCSNTSALAVQA